MQRVSYSAHSQTYRKNTQLSLQLYPCIQIHTLVHNTRTPTHTTCLNTHAQSNALNNQNIHTHLRSWIQMHTRAQRNMHTRTHMDTFTHMDTHPQGPITYLPISLSLSCSFKHPKWFFSKAKWRSLRATYHLIITIIGFWVSVLFFEKKNWFWTSENNFWKIGHLLKNTMISKSKLSCWKIISILKHTW